MFSSRKSCTPLKKTSKTKTYFMKMYNTTITCQILKHFCVSICFVLSLQYGRYGTQRKTVVLFKWSSNTIPLQNSQSVWRNSKRSKSFLHSSFLKLNFVLWNPSNLCTSLFSVWNGLRVLLLDTSTLIANTMTATFFSEIKRLNCWLTENKQELVRSNRCFHVN